MSYTLTFVGNQPPGDTETPEAFDEGIKAKAAQFAATLPGLSHAVAETSAEARVNLIERPTTPPIAQHSSGGGTNG